MAQEMDFRRSSFGLVSVLVGTSLLAGCRSQPEISYTTWSEKTTPYVPSSRSDNAFDSYVLAAEDLERAVNRYREFKRTKALEAAQKLEKKSGKPMGEKERARFNELPLPLNEAVSFTPDGSTEALKVAMPAYRMVIEAFNRKCDFRFVPRNVLEVAPHVKNWRLIGRCFVWEIQNAIRDNEMNSAVRAAIEGTKFGFDLTEGGALEASLGFTIVAEIRRTLAPHLSKLTDGQCSVLATGMQTQLERKPGLKSAIENEKKSMLRNVQLLQDTFRSNDYHTILESVGPSVKETITYLREDLSRKDTEKKKAFFVGMAAEANDRTEEFLRNSEQFTAKRVWKDYRKDKSPRPWRRFAPHFFTAIRPLIELNDEAVARTRLLILEALLTKVVKATGGAPRNLDAYDKSIALDPYNGVRFQYRPMGANFRLYSAGPNGVDDGGATDDAFTYPDLTLEHR